MARIKSHRASARELREAKQRLKEIEREFRDLELLPETKKGEEREARYARVLKVRAMRERFEAQHPYDKRPHPNSMLLALVMVVATVVLCGCVFGSTYVGLRLLTSKPDPLSAADNFWAAMEGQQYSTVHQQYLAPTLRVQKQESSFVNEAQQADIDYGAITKVTLQSQQQPDANDATLVYAVTRTNSQTGKATKYNATLTLELFTNSGTWGVSDLGATIEPTLAGVTPPAITPTAAPTATPKGH
jgi:hypothetical protein